MRKLLLVFLFLPLYSMAQKDTSFWFTAPEIVEFLSGNPHDKPLLFRLTSFGSAANVTISIPANPGFTPLSTTIAANSTTTVDLSIWDALIENSQANAVANKGILIRSTADITAYYEVKTTCNCNPELFALKGRSALGNEFIVASQKEWPIDTVRFPTARSAFNIVATENNTIINITPSQALIGRPAGIPFTITLNRGQTFSNQGLYRNGPSLLNGSIITSDKPISVTASEDLLMADGPCADLAGDQLIPTSIWGDEFVVIRGGLNNKDKAVITAMSNSTAIYLNGNATPVTTINRGQSYEFNLISPTVYIKTSKRVSVYHYTGINCEIGSAVIPKINCTGSQDVAITRSIDEDATVFIVTRQGFQSGFSVNGSNTIITSADFSIVPGSAGAYVYCKKNLNSLMTTGVATRFINSGGKFSLGFLNGANPAFTSGCRYGYFSDFKSSSVTNSQTEICRLDSTQLNAFGGISYQWSPSAGLSSSTIANPKASPSITTDYKVVITTAEGCIDSAFVKVIVNNCQPQPLSCNNWLATPSAPSYAEVGDLDVAGTQITVEAVFNRTTPFSGGDLYAGNLVSKHNHPTTVNYLLRPNSAEITTSNGYFIAQAPCGIELNKTYHVAMVYNGSTLKFYRNGFLMAQVNATGTLHQNDLRTRIGWLDYIPVNENFIGYINEVRIWNVAKTQPQIRTFMNSTLPSPTTQAGLLGYYSFDNLVNKQGNTTYNGILGGSASINATNPSCTMLIDSCAVLIADSIIVNNYTPVLALDICKNLMTVENATAFNIGDTVLIAQMKGAVIDSTNTAAFGTITDYKNAGNYEFNYVKSKTGNVVELKNKLLRPYDIPTGKVQLVRVPYYFNANFNDKVLTCLPWDGNKGGILAINVRDTLTLNANIDVSARGFRGGRPVQNATYICNVDSFYVVNANGIYGGAKGESIVSSNRLYGRGKFASGGGGGNSTNAGGAGGANGGNGGSGGKQFLPLLPSCNPDFNNGGIGGQKYIYNNATNKLFLGGGGGAGHDNESLTTPAGNGGGIAIINSNYINPGSHQIISIGGTPLNIDGLNEDGRSGGGAGGTVALQYNTLLQPILVNVKGGNGDFSTAALPQVNVHGPGGGGAGGIIWINKSAFEPTLSTNIGGGQNGVNINLSNNPWGATAGENGLLLNNLVLPVTTTLFKPNIDSVRFNFNSTSCSAFNFNGFGYTNSQPIVSWNWYFGDGGQANTQNSSHIYATAGTYNVKLVVTDVNGCKDSLTRPVTTSTVTAFAGGDASYCSNSSVTHQLTGTPVPGATYSWQPAALLNNSSIANPVATISATTRFYFTVSLPGGCSGIDSVDVFVNPLPAISSIGDTSLCLNGNLVLNASGGSTYSWSPASAVSNPNIANPVFIGTTNQTLTVTGTSAAGCSASSSLTIVVKPLPVIRTIADSTFCFSNSITLNTTGGQSYSWSPATGLSNPSIANPVFTGNSSTQYIVTGLGANGCSNKDTVNLDPVTTRYPAFAGNDASYCSNGSITHQLSGTTSGAINYSWTPTGVLNNPSIANPIATISNTTKFYLTVTGTQFCAGIDSVEVFVNPVPVITSFGDTSVCVNGSLTLTAAGGNTYNWSPATAVNNPNIANPVFVATGNQTLTVTGTSAAGCSASSSFNVVVKPLPTVQTITDSTICNTQSITLTTIGAQTYSWSPATGLNNPSISSPVFSGSTGSTYVVTGTAGNGCSAKDTVVIEVRIPGVFNIPPNKAVCQNGSVVLDGANGSNVTYQWSPANTLNDPSIINPVASPTLVGNNAYTVTISETTCNSSSTYPVNVLVHSLPNIEANRSNDIDCTIRTSQLSATGASQYAWTPASTLNNAGIANPTASPASDTKYIVTGTDANGCQNKDSVMVLVKGTNGRFDIPNSFTPNGDGLNDCFGVKHWGDATNFRMMIFNRYGEKIFESTNINQCWDGTYKGQPANIGSYVYYIKSTNLCGEMVKKGNLLLIH